MKSNTIEVNGKHYDAVTGAVVGVATAPPLRSGGRNIDGFFRPRTLTTQVTKTPPVKDSVASLGVLPKSAPVLSSAHTAESRRRVNHARAHQPQHASPRTIHVAQPAAQSHSFKVRRGAPNHIRHHTAQHSRTLRRDSVPAPQPSTHSLLKPRGAVRHAAPGVIELKSSAAYVDPERLARAQSAARSPMIAHHGAVPRHVAPMFAPVAVQPTPSAPPVTPVPAPNNGDAPTVPPPQPTNKPIDTNIFEHALANADHYVDIRSHRAHYKKKVHSHVAGMALGSLALIIIAAFVAYQNNPALQLKVASLKAGVSTSMPDFAAAGFHYNGVRAGDGKLMVGFKGHGGDFQLTQTDTNLSGSDMIQSINATDASGTPVYTSVKAGNVTVYRFSNTSATWVSGGKWYTVSGTGALSNDQVKTLVQHV